MLVICVVAVEDVLIELLVDMFKGLDFDVSLETIVGAEVNGIEVDEIPDVELVNIGVAVDETALGADDEIDEDTVAAMVRLDKDVDEPLDGRV